MIKSVLHCINYNLMGLSAYWQWKLVNECIRISGVIVNWSQLRVFVQVLDHSLSLVHQWSALHQYVYKIKKYTCTCISRLAYNQAFSQMSVQCGHPLFIENFVKYLFIWADLIFWAPTFQILAKSLLINTMLWTILPNTISLLDAV